MIKEALDWLAANFRKDRPPLLAPDDGSGRQFVFDDASGDYEKELPRYNQRERSVSNVESFAAMVLEEARRAGLPSSDKDSPAPTDPRRAEGEWMTVVFTGAGARFYLNDLDTRTVFGYVRELAPQWKTLTGADGREMEHAPFVRLLQSLRPSLVESKTLMDFRKINFAAGIQIESAPTLEAGKSGNSYRFDLSVNGRTAGAALPSTIAFRLPFARASAKAYDIEAEVTVELREKADKKVVAFGLILPDRPVIEEQAVSDEVVWFREAVKSLPLLSILEDY